MAIESVGYDGTVDEVQWAKMASRVGTSEYGVDQAGDFAVNVIAGDRALSVAKGTAWGLGVMDTSDSSINILLPQVTSGYRWDLIVLRRDWLPPNGKTTIETIEGSSTKRIPSGRHAGSPGTRDDQPIALVRIQAGSTAIQEIVDLRVWCRNGGQMQAKSDLARSYANAVGTEINVNGVLWQRTVGANNTAEWQKTGTVGDTGWVYVTSGFASGWGGSNAYMVYRVRNGVCHFRIRFGRTGNTVYSPASGNITNTKVAKAPVPARPVDDWMPLAAGVVGPLAAGIISPNGDVEFVAVAPNSVIQKSTEYTLAGTYFVD